MNLKRLCSMLLCVTMVFSMAVVNVSAENYQPSIGKNTANLIAVPMTGTVGAVLTLGLGSVNKDMAASEHIAKAGFYGGTVLASVNGGFFNAYYKTAKGISYPDNCAYTFATLVQNGQVINAGGTMPMLGFTTDGRAIIDKVTCDVKAIYRRDEAVPASIWGVNCYSTNDSAIYLITPLCGYSVPLASGAVIVRIKGGIVSKIEQGKTAATCASDEQLVIYNKTAWTNTCSWFVEPQPGNCAEIRCTYTPSDTADTSAWAKLATGVGCGPWLLQNGVDVFDQYQTVDPSGTKMSKNSSAQRTFAAVMKNGVLILGEVSGSFGDIIKYLQSIGAVDALALDGGASSALISDGVSYLQTPGRKLTNMIHIIDFGSASKLPKRAAAMDLTIPSNWADGFINSAYENGLIPSGFDVAAKENITRLEFCKLAKALVLKYQPDLTYLRNKDGLSYDSVTATIVDTRDNDVVDCIRMGICKGKSQGRFDPNGSITREEAATMLANLGSILGFDFTRESIEFSDKSNFASYAPTFIDKAYRYGMMDGTANGFDAKGYFTKEQAITVFVKILP